MKRYKLGIFGILCVNFLHHTFWSTAPHNYMNVHIDMLSVNDNRFNNIDHFILSHFDAFSVSYDEIFDIKKPVNFSSEKMN